VYTFIPLATLAVFQPNANTAALTTNDPDGVTFFALLYAGLSKSGPVAGVKYPACPLASTYALSLMATTSATPFLLS